MFPCIYGPNYAVSQPSTGGALEQRMHLQGNKCKFNNTQQILTSPNHIRGANKCANNDFIYLDSSSACQCLQ